MAVTPSSSYPSEGSFPALLQLVETASHIVSVAAIHAGACRACDTGV
jgi:hypothetical protein